MKVLTRCLTSGDRGKRLFCCRLEQRANKPDEDIRLKLGGESQPSASTLDRHTFAVLPSFAVCCARRSRPWLTMDGAGMLARSPLLQRTARAETRLPCCLSTCVTTISATWPGKHTVPLCVAITPRRQLCARCQQSSAGVHLSDGSGLFGPLTAMVQLCMVCPLPRRPWPDVSRRALPHLTRCSAECYCYTTWQASLGGRARAPAAEEAVATQKCQS